MQETKFVSSSFKEAFTSVPTLSLLYQDRSTFEATPLGRSHTLGEKPHPCKECGRCFAQPAKLRYHVHTKHSVTRAAASVQDIEVSERKDLKYHVFTPAIEMFCSVWKSLWPYA